MSTDLQNVPTKAPDKPLVVSQYNSNPVAFLTDTAAYNHLWRIAMGYSRSQLIPMTFRGKPDDCFIICQLAIRLGVDPFTLMQATYVVHGRPAFEAKLAIAMLNSSGKIKGTVKTTFSGTGDDYGCRASCVDRTSGEKVEGPKVDWKMVKGEGWNKDKPLRDGQGVQKSKWNTMPDLMFVYRAAAFLIRTNYPEVLMGMPTVDEAEDIDTNQQPMQLSNQERLETLLAGAPEPGEEKKAEAAPEPDGTHEAAIDVASEPATPEPVEQEAAAMAESSEPGAEADLLDEFLDQVTQAKNIESVNALQKQYLAAVTSDAGRQKVYERAEKRRTEIRGTRGPRTNQREIA